MGRLGAIPVGVSEAIETGQEAVCVDVDGTTMSFVPDAHRDSTPVWWTRLSSFVESEELVAAKHASSSERRKKLNRLRFVDYLPGAKVLVWNGHKTVFIYVKHGLSKHEASAAVRAALQAAGRPKLSAAHAAMIPLGVAGGLHFPMWVAHWPLPKGAVAAAGGSFTVAAVLGASVLVFQSPIHPGHFPAASLPPVTAQAAPVVLPVPPSASARGADRPSAYVQVDPRITPVSVPTVTATAPKPEPSVTPVAVPAPEPSSVPAPQPSGVPYPLPSGLSDSPAGGWWQSAFPPNW